MRKSKTTLRASRIAYFRWIARLASCAPQLFTLTFSQCSQIWLGHGEGKNHAPYIALGARASPHTPPLWSLAQHRNAAVMRSLEITPYTSCTSTGMGRRRVGGVVCVFLHFVCVCVCCCLLVRVVGHFVCRLLWSLGSCCSHAGNANLSPIHFICFARVSLPIRVSFLVLCVHLTSRVRVSTATTIHLVERIEQAKTKTLEI